MALQYFIKIYELKFRYNSNLISYNTMTTNHKSSRTQYLQ